ncbi:MAG: alpha-glucan family phosphorylase [Pseudomonadota bacterium]|nr:alpha-glucan family phosphorylase [Pseudomonadota bacterium]
MLTRFLGIERVAYFTMEIAAAPQIPTYGGGLGILAGDTLRTAADLELPVVAVSLVSRSGYFRQSLSVEGLQSEAPDPWDPAASLTRLAAKVAVPIENRDVWVCAWLYTIEAHSGGRAPVIFLDTDLPENEAADRELTHRLYGGDTAYRLKQEIVLGIGGLRMLAALGFRIRKYHMNEGHAALLALELLRQAVVPPPDQRPGEPPYDLPDVRERCIFTTHTPVGAGHDQFDYPLVDRLLGNFVERDTLRRLAGSDRLDMTQLALNLSGYVNGVAKRHAEISRRMYPGYIVRAVTNGVHPHTWTHPAFAALYDRHLPGWCHEPEMLVRADCCLGDDDVWQAHAIAKRGLVERVRALTGVSLDPDLPTLGFARRMTAYKRPELLFSDLDRLRAIARRRPFQVVLAGKAHPRDEDGKRRTAQVHAALRALAPDIRGAFLPNYDMALAQVLIPGVDVWLNTPQRPLEASGTSGMKAALNGVPSLSVLDGWWIEGCVEGITGWSIGDGPDSASDGDAESLYAKLEREVLPKHAEREAWIRVMKRAISHNGSVFTSHRMMRRYASEAYL